MFAATHSKLEGTLKKCHQAYNPLATVPKSFSLFRIIQEGKKE